ncbi:MAG: hypothetical protein HOK21_03090 [Rhodospirillaceae bacterium]|jgi:hypothetical protein|nr:hypothetical protein [Rhodospirillaceae bacterium]MBT4043467.1 hypothetical protein [Rhodospirillaceae bacterium]MBT4688699.1 hypothetical protein [Rhodospirillaceae bacterium]MBT5080957.1 hypothetical protein [Rhodospirillaceae bacterium]MBT5523046.1 hypothetical protein [Rhodospirillaceae bacterium]
MRLGQFTNFSWIIFAERDADLEDLKLTNHKPLPRVDDQGVIDMHVHVGPEFIRRRYDPFTLAEEARREGFGVVMKNHFQPTTAWASLATEEDDTVPLVGSIALNLGCGGIDSHGIRSALSGWKTDTTASEPRSDRFVVWMPTVCAESHLNQFGRRDMDLNWGVDEKYTTFIDKGEGLQLRDHSGEIIEGLGRALDTIAEHDLVLASGHLAGPDTQLLVKNAHEAGVRRMILTHPLWHAIELSPDQVRDLYKEYGVYSELCYSNLEMHGIDDLTINDYLEVIHAVGPEGVILSSDCGQTFTPTIGDSLREFFTLLRQAGISDDDITQMSVINPNKLLFGSFGD